MSRLQAASDRLNTALNKLEAAVESRLARDVNTAASGGDEVEALQGQLAALREDYQKLTRTTETVSARLDGAVDQLKLVLGDEREQRQA